MYQSLKVLLLLCCGAGITGCSSKLTTPIPPATGDFVNSRGGVATARVFGIEFQIDAVSGAVESENFIDANLPEGRFQANKRFVIGDEVSVELQSVSESAANFRCNGKAYGELRVGDQVAIDAEREVQVNGVPRAAGTSTDSSEKE